VKLLFENFWFGGGLAVLAVVSAAPTKFWPDSWWNSVVVVLCPALFILSFIVIVRSIPPFFRTPSGKGKVIK
jgi:hypothetical protein